MLHVVLLILKIIGLIILGILGLLLGIMLLVLLVPVRYRVDGSYYGKPGGTARITWLLHILSIRITFEEDIDAAFRVLGYRLFRKSKEREKTVEDAAETVKAPGEAIIRHVEDPLFSRDSDPVENMNNEELDELVQIQELPNGKQVRRTNRIGLIVKKIKFLLKQVYEALKNIKNTYMRVSEFLKSEENQKTLKLILRQIKAIVRHILPRKASGTVTFGFDDPYTTGQVLSAASIFYAWYGQQIVLVPMFEQVILEGELRVKGRIRVGTLLWRGLLVYLNRNFRVLLKRWWKS